MKLSTKLTIGIILLIACGIMIRVWSIEPSNLSKNPLSDVEGNEGIFNKYSSNGDWIDEKDIFAYNDYLKVKGDFDYSGVLGSGSMLPCITAYSTLIYTKNFTHPIPINTMVVYKAGNGTIVHRIIGSYEKDDKLYYILKGDNNLIIDEPISYGDITYVVVGVLY